MKNLSKLAPIILIIYFSLLPTIAWSGKNEIITIEIDITTAIKEGQFETVELLCNNALKKGLLNQNILENYLFAAIRTQGFAPENFRRVHDFFTQAIKTIQTNLNIITNYIFLAGRAGQFPNAREIFNIALDINLINSDIITNYMFAAIKNNNFEEVERAFTKAQERNLLNEAVLANYIFAAKKFRNFAALKKAAEILLLLRKKGMRIFNDYELEPLDAEIAGAADHNGETQVAVPLSPRIRRRINLTEENVLPRIIMPRARIVRRYPRINIRNFNPRRGAGAAASSSFSDTDSSDAGW